ncbi:NUC2-like protein [Mya arenaria]|uniref:NUC2-like protein n=1 Tax=Mya arenaria TaxID=6604 RepID=A0ABY7E1U0_MYAAR|nr:NUC2-like protein [Mya arenaria]
MERAARKKRLRIIITTRHYIKEEALEELDKSTIFDDKEGYVLLLSSTRDFLMERVTIAPARTDELRVVVPSRHYDTLCGKFAKMIGRKNCNLMAKEPPHHEFQHLQRKGPRSNTVDALSDIDFGILKHNAFKDEGFVKKFIRYIREKQLDQDLFTVPVMKMTGYFLDYGIKMTEMVMNLPGYTLYSGLSVLAKELIEQEVFPKNQVDPLLLATHSGDIGMMELLLNHGAKVSGDTIYVAMHKRGSTFDSNKVLDTIVEFQGIDINDKGNAVNGNYPLIVAARKGFTNAVKCMLQHGADPSVKNDKNLTALHKAVIYKHAHIIKLLIDHNSPLDARGGTFKRSPLHIAADLGSYLVAINRHALELQAICDHLQACIGKAVYSRFFGVLLN